MTKCHDRYPGDAGPARRDRAPLEKAPASAPASPSQIEGRARISRSAPPGQRFEELGFTSETFSQVRQEHAPTGQ